MTEGDAARLGDAIDELIKARIAEFDALAGSAGQGARERCTKAVEDAKNLLVGGLFETSRRDGYDS